MSVVDKESWRQPNKNEVGHATQNGWAKRQAKPVHIIRTEQPPALLETIEDTFLFLLGIVAVVVVVTALIVTGLVIYP